MTATATTTPRLRIGVVGAGHFGRYHALKAAASCCISTVENLSLGDSINLRVGDGVELGHSHSVWLSCWDSHSAWLSCWDWAADFSDF